MGANKFTDEEVNHMLELIKKTPDFHTSNMQEKLMIYVDIAKQMQNAKWNTFRRTGSQVRHKFELMEQAYRKVKENSKSSSRNRHAIKYFKILDEIFGGQAQQIKPKKKWKKQQTKADTEVIKQEDDPLSVTDNFLIKEECVEGEVNEEKTASEESTDAETTDKSSEEAEEEIQNEEPYNDEDNKSFERIKRNFITNLVESERHLVDSIKELDKKYTRNYKHHCKCKEAILRKDRQEIELILEKDRKEMLKIFDAVLETLNKPNVASLDDSDDESLPLAAIAKRRKIAEENV